MRPKNVAGWLVLAGVLLYLFLPVSLKLKKLKAQFADLEADIQRLSARNQVLENELRLLKTDPVYVESVARKTFNKSKDGEVIYKLVEPEEEKKEAPATRP